MTNPLSVEVVVSEENSFSDPFEILAGETCTVSTISALFSGTIVLQRQLPGQSSFYDITDPDGSSGWTFSAQFDYYASERQKLRIGCKTGAYTSGSMTCRLGKG